MENLRGALFMTLSMLGFAIEDGMIKALSDRIPPGQLIIVLSAGAAVALVVWLRATGQPLIVPAYRNRIVLLRTFFEVLGTLMFISAIARAPVTTLSAILQATPLVVAMGGAIFLQQTVGWRRWSAILVGFIGVLFILRPGAETLEFSLLLGLGGMFGLAARDLATRAITVEVSGPHLALHAFYALVPAGIFLCWFEGTPLVVPSLFDSSLLLACIIIGLMAYLAIVLATRSGNAAFISSFRYSRMVFALFVGILFLNESPDAYTLIGAAIVIVSGLYALWRESQIMRSKA